MKKVLVIEDDEAIRENTAELLAISDYHVFTAENGRTGFEQAKTYHPDVVLCDMMMPDTDGRRFIELVKNHEILRHVPIIFFSAGTLPAKEQQKLIRASNGFLKKPFLEEDLLSMIQSVLNNRSNQQPSAVV
jgi:CheY-like chemotaxis protein